MTSSGYRVVKDKNGNLRLGMAVYFDGVVAKVVPHELPVAADLIEMEVALDQMREALSQPVLVYDERWLELRP